MAIATIRNNTDGTKAGDRRFNSGNNELIHLPSFFCFYFYNFFYCEADLKSSSTVFVVDEFVGKSVVVRIHETRHT